MRSIERWNEISKELEPIDEKLSKYYLNKIALRNNVLDDLKKAKYALHKEQKASCPHDQCVIKHGSYTDRGYGCDRHYYHHDLFCSRCETYLNLRTDGDGRIVSQVFPLEEIIETYLSKESMTDDELRKIGIIRQRTTQTTYKTSFTRV